MKRIILTIFSLLILCTTMAQEADTLSAPAVRLDEANTAYINGDYDKAQQLYESILEEGLFSSVLYYNLGNSYFKRNKIAEALLYYYKAQLLDPTNADIKHNIEVAEAQTKDRIEELPRFVLAEWNATLRNALGCTGWTILSLVALAVALGSFMLYILSQALRLRKVGFYLSLSALLLFVIATSYALGERNEMLHSRHGVVMSRSLPVKSSPNNGATDLFILHAGTRVRLKSEISGWREVLLSDGKKGWVVAENISEI